MLLQIPFLLQRQPMVLLLHQLVALKQTVAVIQLTSPIVMRMTGSTPNTTPQKRSNQERSPLLDDEHNDSFTSSEKRQRELEESEKLAWQLMEEESMNAYQIQVDYMRNHPELFDAADLAALGAVLNDNTNTQGHENEEEGDENVGQSGENNNEVEEDNSAE